MIINRNNIKILLLACCFVISYRLTLRTPLYGFFLKVEAAFLVFVVLFCFAYFANLAVKKERFFPIEVYVISILILPAYSAYFALLNFGQPFIYGFFACRQFYLVLTALLLLFLLRNRIINLSHVKASFIFLSWSCLLVYTILWLLIDPGSYDKKTLRDTFGSFIRIDAKVTGVQGLVFRIDFIVFGFFYYIINYFKTKRTLNIFYATLFFCYLFFFQLGRGVVVAVIMTTFVFFIKKVPFNFKIRTLTIFCISMFVLISATAIVAPEFLKSSTSRFTHMYTNAFITILGQNTDETSTSLRLVEFSNISKHIFEKPLFGNGRFSFQWSGRGSAIVGFFAPSELG
mgnify:FL=1